MGGSKRAFDRCAGLKRDRSARVIVRGDALMQNIRRGHYELGVEARAHRRVAHSPSSSERSEWTRTAVWVLRGTVRPNATESS